MPGKIAGCPLIPLPRTSRNLCHSESEVLLRQRTGTIICVTPHEIRLAICDARAGAGDCGDGFGADRDAPGHSRAGGCSAAAGRTVSGGSGANRLGTRIADVNRAAVLQPADSRGADHVATAAAGDEGTARLAGAGGAEPGADAGRDSGCDGTERTRGRVEHSAARAGCGFDGGSAVAGDSGGSGAGAEPVGERDAGAGSEDQFAGDGCGAATGVRDAEFCGATAGQRESNAAG